MALFILFLFILSIVILPLIIIKTKRKIIKILLSLLLVIPIYFIGNFLYLVFFKEDGVAFLGAIFIIVPLIIICLLIALPIYLIVLHRKKEKTENVTKKEETIEELEEKLKKAKLLQEIKEIEQKNNNTQIK